MEMKLTVLGREVKPGDIYNYVSDEILPCMYIGSSGGQHVLIHPYTDSYTFKICN